MRLLILFVVALGLALSLYPSEGSAGGFVPGRISGLVRDIGGTPIAGATVQATRLTCCTSYGGSTVSDANGLYEINGLLPGDYEVNGDAVGWAPYYSFGFTAFVSSGSISRDVDVLLQQSASISGRVTHLGTGVEGASVFAANIDDGFPVGGAQTDGDGFYVITDLHPDAVYRVIAGVFGGSYAPEYFDDSYTEAGATNVFVGSGNVTPNINFDLAIGGAISGEVTLPGGAPAANAQVTVSNASWALGAQADGDGNYTVPGLPPGQFVVRASEEFGTAADTYFSDKFDEQTADSVNVTLGTTSTSIDIDLGAFGSISGSIAGISGPFGGDVTAERTVCCLFNGTGVMANGPYAIPSVTPGCYRIRASSVAGFEYYSEEFHEKNADVICVDPAEAVTGIDFTLAPLDNDFIAQITNVFTLPFSDNTSNLTATLEAGEATPCGNIGRTLWYRFELPSASAPGTTVRVDTSGTFDRAIAVYSGDPLISPPGGFTEIDCEGDPSFGYLDFTGTPGATYYVQLGGRNGAGGSVGVSIFCLQDFDCDGVSDSGSDNCNGIFNPGQDDHDEDGIGDFCDNDVDGDGLPNFEEHDANTDEFRADTDGDGCVDGAEALGTDPAFGGLRDPLNKWDFFDVDENANIDLSDTLAILGKFGSLPGDDVYVERFDRMIPIGNPGYETAQASGDAIGIDLGDALANLQSFGHLCAI